ncbi:ATP-dependent DNA/RNA helicase [Sporothrix eucalyptigena]|uniref:RNA helicase n=1 Tax=Sporothrix eucalyptigena TaxID=1812306 RepID=A0ABP0BNF2_9PEZI
MKRKHDSEASAEAVAKDIVMEDEETVEADPAPAADITESTGDAVADATTSTDASSSPALSFADLNLDHRLLQAIVQQKFSKPTLVQQKAIPLAVNGKDLLAKAKTGSGKTAAYLLPIMHAILRRKQHNHNNQFTAALILVPTRELADQVTKSIAQFSAFCARDISAIKLTDKVSDGVLRSFLSNLPDIVVSTPARAWHAITNGFMSLKDLTHLVLDEADLVLSYGYNEDLEQISASLPKGIQAILMSATLSTEVETLKGMLCRNPIVLDLVEKEADGEGVSQYFVKCAEDEKFLLAYIIFKIPLIFGKCLIFVSDVDRCYRLKLFFEQFGIRSCILNPELPVNSRIHVIEEFNRNVYDIIIASDERELLGDEEEPAENAEEGETGESSAPKKKKRKMGKRDKEFGVSRGIDFKNVRAVFNFDLPTSSKSYTHRIGRTARAGQTGMALSFVVPSELYRKHMPTTVASAEKDEKILARIIKQQAKVDKEVKPYQFDMKQVESFRYRMNDALRAVTKTAVREARTREIRKELINSEKLKRHFEENPDELHHLVRHDTELRTARTQAHMKHIPDYMMPRDGKNALTPAQIGFVPLRRTDRKDRRKSKYYKNKSSSLSKSAKIRASKSRNPLHTFRATSRK